MTAVPIKVGRVISKNYLHLFTGGLEYKDVEADLRGILAEVAEHLDLDPATIKYRLSMNIIKGQTQGYAYIHFSDRRVFNIILGLTPEGEARVEKYENPKYGQSTIEVGLGKLSLADNWADEPEDEPEFLTRPLGPLVAFPEHKLNALQREAHARVLRTTAQFNRYREDQRLIKRGMERNLRSEDAQARLKRYRDLGWKSGQPLNIHPAEILKLELDKETLATCTAPANFQIKPTPADVSTEEDDVKVRPHEIVAMGVPAWVTADQVHRELADLATTDAKLITTEGRQRVQKPYPVVTFSAVDKGLKTCFVRFDPTTRDARFALFVAKAVPIRGTKPNEKVELSFSKAKSKAR